MFLLYANLMTLPWISSIWKNLAIKIFDLEISKFLAWYEFGFYLTLGSSNFQSTRPIVRSIIGEGRFSECSPIHDLYRLFQICRWQSRLRDKTEAKVDQTKNCLCMVYTYICQNRRWPGQLRDQMKAVCDCLRTAYTWPRNKNAKP